MTKREDESDLRNPQWMWVTVAGTRNTFPGRKQQHEPVYGSGLGKCKTVGEVKAIKYK